MTLNYLLALDKQLSIHADYRSRRLSGRQLKSQQETSVFAERSTLLGQTLYVSSEISELLSANMDTMPDYKITRDKLPCLDGFVYIDGKPIITGDDTTDYGMPVQSEVRAMAWTFVDEIKDKPAAFVTIGFGPIREMAGRTPRETPWLALFHTSVYEHESVSEALLRSRKLAIYDDKAEQMLELGTRWTTSLWAFMQQRLCSRTRHEVDRAGRRRLARALPNAQPWVDVIEFRLRASKRHNPSVTARPSPEWSHRWLVRAHWRNQWYPSLQDHMPALVPVYEKGPADKPLKLARKLFAVVR